jgi:hypothetical protein
MTLLFACVLCFCLGATVGIVLMAALQLARAAAGGDE